MEAHQQRVVDEKAALDEKLNALSNFLGSDIDVPLNEGEFERMEKQRVIMTDYSNVLGERITAF